MDDVVAAINKALRRPVLQYGSAVAYSPRYLPTGIRVLDGILGGGLRRRCLTVLVGDYSSGKTLLCIYFVRSAQARGESVVYIDTEAGFDPAWWSSLGVDVERLAVAQTNDGEEVMNVLLGAIDVGAGLVVVDSLAQIVPPQRREGGVGEMGIGELPRFLNDSLKLALLRLSERRADTVLVATNQVRESLAPGPGGPRTVMPGGRGLGHLAHVILQLRRASWYTGKSPRKGARFDVRTGYEIEVTTIKSKQSVPWQTARIPFDFSRHLDEVAALVNEAVDLGVVEQRGSYYVLDGAVLQGRARLVEYVRERPQLADWLMEETYGRRLAGEAAFTPPPGDADAVAGDGD